MKNEKHLNKPNLRNKLKLQLLEEVNLLQNQVNKMKNQLKKNLTSTLKI